MIFDDDLSRLVQLYLSFVALFFSLFLVGQLHYLFIFFMVFFFSFSLSSGICSCNVCLYILWTICVVFDTIYYIAARAHLMFTVTSIVYAICTMRFFF